MDVVHDPQRPGVYLRSAVVPHKVTQPRRHHAQPDQNAPLHGSGRQLLRIAEHKPRRYRDNRRAHIEPRKCVMLRHRAGFHQAFVAHHPDGEADIGELDEHQPGPEVIADFVIANNRRANHRQRGAQQVSPAQTALAEQVVNQRDVERRQHGKEQEFGDGQIDVGPEAEQIHDAELHRAHQHIEQDRFQRLSPRAQKRQEHQRRQPYAHQHGKVAVDRSGKVFANQTKGEGPQDSGDNE
ncbi:hypothetical protein SS25_01985 [Enterobacter hormaechei subsp. hormaechei]|nr:hypothetical protein SS25_01985 [Enterobacter hormaechei subsp. hormaechei]KJO06716.1 hypothetical protein SS00_01990 [Enterobacter hormaechei subsp. hormaechei]